MSSPGPSPSQVLVGDLVAKAARVTPEAPALEEEARTWTFAGLDQEVAARAHALRARGVGPGDRVAFMAPTGSEPLMLTYACAAVGAVAAPLNSHLPPEEQAEVVALLEPALVVATADYEDPCAEALDRAGPVLRSSFGSGDGGRWPALLDPAGHPRTPPPRPPVDHEAPFAIFCSSGSTGRPKGVVISHRAQVQRALLMALLTSRDPEAAFVAFAPPFHNAALDPVFGAHCSGQSVVVLPRFDAATVAEMVAARRLGWLQLMPGMILPLLEELRRSDGTVVGVDLVGCMADLVPDAQLSELVERLDAPFLNTYGATETGLAPGSGGRLGAPPRGGAPDRAKVEAPFCDVRLAGPDGHDVADGEVGEMLVRSTTMFSGYWADPELTASALAGGWYHSGDLFRRRPDGRLEFSGRRSWMVKTGGENVLPEEVEHVLMEMPAVAAVAVIGVPDDRWGEALVACVEVTAGADLDLEAVRRHCDGRLARYKIPKRVVRLPAGTFRRNATGKVDRRGLSELVASGAGEG